MRPAIAPVCALILAAATAGCGADPYPGEPEDTVHLFLIEDIAGLDPALAQEQISGTCVLNLFDTLYEYHYLKRPFELVPCLATDMPEVSPDGLTYTIRLKEGVRYVDDPCFPDGRGREVTARDVVFCLKRLLDARIVSPGSWILEGYVEGLDAFQEASRTEPRNRTVYEDVPGLRALDDHTVQIRLSQPYPQLLWVLAMPYASVFPPEAVGAYGDELMNHPVGSGPYRVETFNRTQRLVLVRNPDYREDRYPTEGSAGDRELGLLADAGRLLPLNDRVVCTVFTENQPQWLFFMQGFLDRTSIPKDNYDVAIDPATSKLREDLVDMGVSLQKVPALEVIYDSFNMLDPVIGEPAGEKGLAIRRAMSLAFNETWAKEKLYNNRVEPMQGIVSEEFPAYDPTFRNPWKQQQGETREQALGRARALLADAGFPGGRGIPPLTYEVLGNVTDQQFYAAFRRDMAEIGLDIRANRVTWPQLMERTNNGEAQIWGLAWGADYPDAQNFFQLFYGPNRSPGPNHSNFQDDGFDRLYEQSLRMQPGPERVELYRRMQRIVVDRCPWIIKYRRINYNLSQGWFRNYKRNDINEKYFKYVRSVGSERRARIRAWNRRVWTPVWIVAALAAVLLAFTAVGIRHRKRAW